MTRFERLLLTYLLLKSDPERLDKDWITVTDFENEAPPGFKEKAEKAAGELGVAYLEILDRTCQMTFFLKNPFDFEEALDLVIQEMEAFDSDRLRVTEYDPEKHEECPDLLSILR